MAKITVNPDKEFVKEMRQALKDNDGYCPCVPVKSEDSKCMCKEFREMVDRGESGFCHCGLWYAQ